MKVVTVFIVSMAMAILGWQFYSYADCMRDHRAYECNRLMQGQHDALDLDVKVRND